MVTKVEDTVQVTGPYIDTGTKTSLVVSVGRMAGGYVGRAGECVGRAGGYVGRAGVLGITSRICRTGAWSLSRSEEWTVP